jgi:hypothetical protein
MPDEENTEGKPKGIHGKKNSKSELRLWSLWSGRIAC